ncbi:MAG: helix-turn-helix transcriptional regulator [Bacteroidales bacterium]|nr:helix-turn-helix transcriptional regulator [Bacteroidales bacterium]
MGTREHFTYKSYAWPQKWEFTIIYPEMEDIMIRKGWSMSYLAEQAGCTHNTMRHILSGYSIRNGKKVPYNPKKEKLESIAKNLGYSYDVLFGKKLEIAV